VRYLDTHIVSAKLIWQFKCSLSKLTAKRSFYRAANTCQDWKGASENKILEPVNTKCMLALGLLNGFEACPLSHTRTA